MRPMVKYRDIGWAKNNRRWLLTDGIHLTDRAGAAVTDIVTEWLETQPAPN
jgi:hypothetical protein